MNETTMTPEQLELVRAWVKADRDLQQLYASCDPRDPTRVMVRVDDMIEVVELNRALVYGSATVMARRLKIHGA